MDEVPLVGREENDLFKRFISQYDGPAYVRRARRVEDAFRALVDHCEEKRRTMLEIARVRLGMLRALAGDWDTLSGVVMDAPDLKVLRRLEAALEPALRIPPPPTRSQRILRRALCELIESLERFNRRWRQFLDAVDLRPINELRDGYNRYYVLEKEFAVRSARVARHGFVPLAPLTAAALFELLPLLPVPRSR